MDHLDISLLPKLKPCIFRYDKNQLPDFDDKLHFGFIAQDLVKLFPIDKYGVVIVNKLNSKLMDNYNEFIPMLTKWQQIMYDKLNSQQEEIAYLKEEIEGLKKG